jgi:hypothetical protein
MLYLFVLSVMQFCFTKINSVAINLNISHHVCLLSQRCNLLIFLQLATLPQSPPAVSHIASQLFVWMALWRISPSRLFLQSFCVRGGQAFFFFLSWRYILVNSCISDEFGGANRSSFSWLDVVVKMASSPGFLFLFHLFFFALSLQVSKIRLPGCLCLVREYLCLKIICWTLILPVSAEFLCLRLISATFSCWSCSWLGSLIFLRVEGSNPRHFCLSRYHTTCCMHASILFAKHSKVFCSRR